MKKKYRVHVYYEVYQDHIVEADSMEEACLVADREDYDPCKAQNAENLIGFLVDEVEDLEYLKTRYFEAKEVLS